MDVNKPKNQQMDIKTTLKLVPRLCLGLLVGVCLLPPSQAYQTGHGAYTAQYGSRVLNVQVPLNKSKLVHINSDYRTISESNRNIADIMVIPPREVLIQGNSLGTTNIYVLDGNNNLLQTINVEVTHDLDSLKAKLHELLPEEQIEVHSAQRNIVLSGQVSALDKVQAAVDIAQSFLPMQRGGGNSGTGGGSGQNQSSPNSADSDSVAVPGGGGTNDANNTGGNGGGGQRQNMPRVINLLGVSGVHQVMLEVKIAEIDRSLARQLDIQFNAMHPSSRVAFGALNGGGSLNHVVTNANQFVTGFDVLENKGGIAGPIRSLLNHNPHSIDAAGLFMSAVSGDFIFNLTVDAAKDQNLARILAEPTLTTMSGQEAKFISGGEFPIPVAQVSSGNGGTITVVFKEFGISLRCLPVVLDSGRINLNMNVGVSELSQDAAVVSNVGSTDTKFTIPSLTKREASSTLELADGQTMSIAGLISDSLRENVNKFPGLGDVPVLGALFRSEQFLKQQSELVIFVTPKLAKPVLAQNVRLPTDNFIEPDDKDFYIFGSLEKLTPSASKMSKGGGLDGQYGHTLMGGTR